MSSNKRNSWLFKTEKSVNSKNFLPFWKYSIVAIYLVLKRTVVVVVVVDIVGVVVVDNFRFLAFDRNPNRLKLLKIKKNPFE